MKSQIFMDKSLAQRLERTEGAINASMVGTRAKLEPASGAAWTEVAGTYAMFDGAGSPMTQSFGLGMQVEATDEVLEELETFFRARGAAAHHETSPLAGVGLFAKLVARGYRPLELSTVLVQPLDEVFVEQGAPAGAAAPRVRLVREGDRARWIETMVRGWAQLPAYAAAIRGMATVSFANSDMLKFIAEGPGGEPMATGGLALHGEVALLAGASTIPEHRSRGAQAVLLAARLAYARARGCDVAMMVTEPGSTSQRNAERRGFRVAYTRTKWALG
ncbi:hypothetical protein [Pendulispora albinea]|uniref:N-acetyltransferase domain-containing protein n=1 Tax=Pendulispora albinea TaxID=2741071 RepID=A0ABZ2M4Y4_9BACT